MTTHHQYVLLPLFQVGAVTQIGGPHELPVLQAEAVPVGVDHLDVVACLLASVHLPQDFAPENCETTTVQSSIYISMKKQPLYTIVTHQSPSGNIVSYVLSDL